MSYRIHRSALVAYSAQQMFDLVNDIEAYPRYMEGCSGAQVLKREGDWLEAQLELSKAGVSQRFITRNQLLPPERMTMTLVDGPFTYLKGHWQFQPLAENACKVTFELEFELNNKLLGLAVGKLMESVAGKQVDAVCARARQLYR